MNNANRPAPYRIVESPAGHHVLKVSTGTLTHAMKRRAAMRVLMSLLNNPGPRP